MLGEIYAIQKNYFQKRAAADHGADERHEHRDGDRDGGRGFEIRGQAGERHFAFFGAHVFQRDKKTAADERYF